MYSDVCCCVMKHRSLSKVENPWNQSRECHALTLSPSRQQQQQRPQPKSATVIRLPKAQRRFCSRRLWMMPAVAHAARSAADVCQELFADKRWNCSSVLLAPKLTPDLTEGNVWMQIVLAAQPINHRYTRGSQLLQPYPLEFVTADNRKKKELWKFLCRKRARKKRITLTVAWIFPGPASCRKC